MSLRSKNLAVFYHQLGAMLEAGVSIQNALETLQRTCPAPVRKAVGELRAVVLQGRPLHEGLTEKFFSPLDIRVLGIAEQSGGLDRALRSLARHHEHRAESISKIQVAMILPSLILLAGVCVVPLPKLILSFMGQGQFSVTDYLLAVARSLLPWIGIPWCGVMLVRAGLRIEGFNVGLDRMINAVPIFGTFRRSWMLAQWTEAVRLMLNAGIGVLDAIRYASHVRISPSLAGAMHRVDGYLNGQMEVSRVLEASGFFPPIMIQYWSSGEQSGRLDESLDKLVTHLNEESHRCLKIVTAVLPAVAYGGVCIYMVVQILKFAQGYFHTLNSMMDSL